MKCSDRCTPHTSPSLAVERLKDEREERSYFDLDERFGVPRLALAQRRALPALAQVHEYTYMAHSIESISHRSTSAPVLLELRILVYCSSYVE